MSQTSETQRPNGRKREKSYDHLWSEPMLAQLESMTREHISSNDNTIHTNKSHQWKESTLAAGMMAEEKELTQDEIPTITPASSEEEVSPFPLTTPSSSFNDDKENNATGNSSSQMISSEEKSTSHKSTIAISKSRKKKKIIERKRTDDDDDAQSVASNISRVRAKQKLLRLHSANKLAESRRRLSLQQQASVGQQYLSTRDASSVTSRTTISEWSTMHHTPVHRRSSIPRQVLVSDGPILHDLRQSPVHESKDCLTVTTESERVLQERLSQVQDELVGTRQIMKFLFSLLVLGALGLFFHDELVIVAHSRFRTLQQVQAVFGHEMRPKMATISMMPVEEPICHHQLQSTHLRNEALSTDETISKSQANKRAILDRAQRILQSKNHESGFDVRNPDYIGLLLSQ